MKYDWEDEFLEYFNNEDDNDPPEQFLVVAIAVVNTETGEAALIEVGETGEETGSVTQAEYLRDILADAKARYSEALADMGAWYMEWHRVH